MKLYLVIYRDRDYFNYEYIKKETPESAAEEFDTVHVAEVKECWDVETVTEVRLEQLDY